MDECARHGGTLALAAGQLVLGPLFKTGQPGQFQRPARDRHVGMRFPAPEIDMRMPADQRGFQHRCRQTVFLLLNQQAQFAGDIPA